MIFSDHFHQFIDVGFSWTARMFIFNQVDSPQYFIYYKNRKTHLRETDKIEYRKQTK